MSHESQLRNPKYRSWVKSGLGLKYLKEGLEHFSMEVMDEQHQAILMTVRKASKSPTCNLCHTNTLQPNHVRTKSNHCPLGAYDCNCRQPRGKFPCPNDLCGAMYDHIINIHGSTPPAPYWRNTNATLWSTDPWEIAKCFVNAPGYANTTSAINTDCAGLLHLIVNNLAFHSRLDSNIDGSDVFCKTRQYRNEILHSPTMEVEVEEADKYIDDMIAILQDAKELAARPECIEAARKLRELKEKDFTITTQNETEVIQEMRAELQKATDESLENIKVAADDRIDNIDRKVKDAGDAIQLAKTHAIGEIQTFHSNLLNVSTPEIGEQVDKGLQTQWSSVTNHNNYTNENAETVEKNPTSQDNEYLTTASSEVTELSEEKLTEVYKSVENIRISISKQKVSDSSIHTSDDETACLPQPKSRIGTTSLFHLEERTLGDGSYKGTNEQLEYESAKTVFKKRLIELYMDTVVRVSALPLNPDKDETTIHEFYVSPWLTLNGSSTKELRSRHKTDETHCRVTRTISSYNEIFLKDGKRMKLIYIIGDAGSGKSAFCKNLIYEWCTAHSRVMEMDSEEMSLATESKEAEEMVNEEILKSFEFLFYISLRHNTDSCDIKTMLNNQYEDPILEKVLEQESVNCLLLLDGLDEWKAPTWGKVSQFQTVGLPKRDRNKEYTVVTTSRPWKVELLKIKESEIDNKIRLRGIEHKSAIKLAKSVVSYLNKMFEENKSANRFLAKYVLSTEHNKSPLEDFIKSPVMLQQLVCLWFDGKLKHLSRYDIYSSMLELSLEWSLQRSPDDSMFDNFRELSLVMEDVDLPFSLEEYLVLDEYKYVIFNAGKIAYCTLFSDQKESSLTFGHATIKKLGATKDLIQCCLEMGLLTEEQNVTFSLSKRQNTQFAFTHKSIQEVLAAIYIAIKCQNRYDANPKEDVDVGESVVTYFKKLKSPEDLLEQSNVIEIVCGLCPLMAPDVTKYVYGIVERDERFVDFRNSLEDWRTCNVIIEIQELVFGCIKEFISNESSVALELYIADIIIRDKVDIPFLKKIKANSILSITFAGEIWGLSRSSIHLTECDVETLCSVFRQQSTSLRRLAKIEPVTTDALEEVPVYCTLLGTSNTQINALQLKDIRFPHGNMFELPPFVEQNNNLLSLSLIDIRCDVSQCKQHVIDLTGLQKLRELRIEDSSLHVTGINTRELVECNLSGQNSLNILHFLNDAPLLQHLRLSSITFDDNKFVKGLKSLKHIEMSEVQFSIDAWVSFKECVKSFGFVQRLRFQNVNIPNEMRSMFMCDLKNVRTLECLDLKNMSISTVIPQGMTGLKQLCLQNVTCFESDKCEFVDSLHYSSNLENLVLRNIDFKSLYFCLPASLSSLKHIELSNVKLCKEGWVDFVGSLNNLQQFESLELQSMAIPEKVLSFSTHMKKLRNVSFMAVNMDLPSWMEFVDSVSLLPQPVEVQTVDLCIKSATSSEAIEYVQKKKGIFQVTVKFGVDCNFRTKKT